MAWELLFSSDIGLLSLFTIVFVIVIGTYLYRYARKQMVEDEAKAKLNGR
jgi:cbb3-type cytochrome oxidase subunit 3